MFFIDGFNLYHSLKDMAEGYDASPTAHVRGNPLYYRYKWLDYGKLCHIFVNQHLDEHIVKINYFTALARWKTEALKKHMTYIRALQAEVRDINIVYGNFKGRDVKCNNFKNCNARTVTKCNGYFRTHIEKQTDVNIAISLFENAHTQQYEKASIISGDSDLIPSINAIKANFPGLEIEVIIPPGRQARELSLAADSHRKIQEKHLSQSQLPNQISGGAIKRPIEWSLISKLPDGRFIKLIKDMWKVYDGTSWKVEFKPDLTLFNTATPLTDTEISDLVAKRMLFI